MNLISTIEPKLLFLDCFRNGDLIYTGCLLHTIQQEIPKAQITLILDNSTASLPYIKDLGITVVPFHFPWLSTQNRRNPLAYLKCALTVRRTMRGKYNDWIGCDPRADLRHRILLGQINPGQKVSFKPVYQTAHSWKGEHSQHAFVSKQTFLDNLCLALKRPKISLQWPWIKLPYNTPPHSNRIILAPEASIRLRYYNQSHSKNLSKLLAQQGYEVIWVANTEIPADEIIAESGATLWRGNLRELGILISSARAVIAVDSFTGHLAAAIGTPVVSLFGPAMPEMIRPWGDAVEVVMTRNGYPCRPCRQHICVMPNNSCMDSIHPQTIVNALQILLSKVSSQSKLR